MTVRGERKQKRREGNILRKAQLKDESGKPSGRRGRQRRGRGRQRKRGGRGED